MGFSIPNYNGEHSSALESIQNGMRIDQSNIHPTYIPLGSTTLSHIIVAITFHLQDFWIYQLNFLFLRNGKEEKKISWMARPSQDCAARRPVLLLRIHVSNLFFGVTLWFNFILFYMSEELFLKRPDQSEVSYQGVPSGRNVCPFLRPSVRLLMHLWKEKISPRLLPLSIHATRLFLVTSAFIVQLNLFSLIIETISIA